MRLFMHLYNSIGATMDEEGAEFPDLDAAHAVALTGVRSLLAEEVGSQGKLDLNGRLEIARKDGEVLRVVPFAEAVEVRGPA
jgi:hypothetical protein